MKTFARRDALPSLSLLVVAGLLPIACTETGTSPEGGDSGPPTDGGTEAAACPTTGAGSLTVNVTGLPDGVSAKIKVTGPSGALTECTERVDRDPEQSIGTQVRRP